MMVQKDISYNGKPHFQQLRDTESWIFPHHSSDNHPAKDLESFDREVFINERFHYPLYEVGAEHSLTEEKMNEVYVG